MTSPSNGVMTMIKRLFDFSYPRLWPVVAFIGLIAVVAR